ncbi:hypothetical protein DID77_01610 [Candidatus Marinamargulisbacteria bacterium SCGC AG-439-L15]|nr:hypothetical protein DID77_01610 [Candidatus Marinamargulisbacteria bacterium SCGC AG-439-L15]
MQCTSMIPFTPPKNKSMHDLGGSVKGLDTLDLQDPCLQDDALVELMFKIADKLELKLRHHLAERVVNLGSSFAWIVDIIQNKSSSFCVTQLILSGNDTDLSTVTASQLNEIKDYFASLDLDSDSILKTSICIVDMSKSGKGLRTLNALFKRFAKERWPQVQKNIHYLIFQPRIEQARYGSIRNNPEFKNVELLDVEKKDEPSLVSICDSDSNRKVMSNKIKEFKRAKSQSFTGPAIELKRSYILGLPGRVFSRNFMIGMQTRRLLRPF